MTTLTLQHIWTAPGYRDLRLVMLDPATRKEYELQLGPKDLQRLIYECADAVKQIGDPHPPIDWDRYPVQIHWPTVTPWAAGPAPKAKSC